ncbi:hypothetical protein JVU11DRAFT_8114 [Chiua virens]|nr:hypothetical protein JVU11DRAFT_8114 [Chiua virens]
MSTVDLRICASAPFIALPHSIFRTSIKKRTALPPQDEVFRPAARPPPVQRGGGHPIPTATSAPATVPETRHTSRKALDDMPRDSARCTPSPPPQLGPSPTERGDRDRGRSCWPKPHVVGPSQMDSHTMHELSRGRAHDIAMDIDDPPLPRSSDPPTRPVPPKRPLQDDVPRYPRAMLNADNDGLSRGLREPREGIDSRHRLPPDDPSRFGPSRDRHVHERHPTEQNSTQKEPVRSAESKVPLSGPNVKLSGTNNTPIGARNKFGANAPPPSMPSSSSHRTSTVASGSNGEPLAPRRDRVDKEHERPPHLDGPADRGAPSELTRREDTRRSPPNKLRALPPVEPAAMPNRPSRAALGISRFGPPIVKENAEYDQPTEPVRPQMSVCSESGPSEQILEGSSRASPPPPSRESSMVSFKDAVVPPSRPTHLPPRPESPPRGHRYRSGDTTKPHRSTVRSPDISDSRGNELNIERPVHHSPPSSSSPISRKRAMDIYPSEPPPAPRDNRVVHSPELSRSNFRDSQIGHPVIRAPAPAPPVVQDEGRAPPPMHPERALMLQVNGLPPRPPSVIGRVRSGRGSKRTRDDRDHERAEPLRGNSRGRYSSVSPADDRRRYPEDDRLGHGGGSGPGASLLDRLTLDDGHVNSPSLRDRVQLPSKRDREEIEVSLDMEGEDYDGLKRRRRGGPKGRKGRL